MITATLGVLVALAILRLRLDPRRARWCVGRRRDPLALLDEDALGVLRALTLDNARERRRAIEGEDPLALVWEDPESGGGEVLVRVRCVGGYVQQVWTLGPVVYRDWRRRRGARSVAALSDGLAIHALIESMRRTPRPLDEEDVW